MCWTQGSKAFMCRRLYYPVQHANPPPYFSLHFSHIFTPAIFHFVSTVTRLLFALFPFLVFPPPLCPSSPLSLLILFISADLTKDKVTEEFPVLCIYSLKGLSESSAVCLHHSLLASRAQGVYLCIHSLKDFQIALIRLSSTNKKICFSWS